MTSIDRRSAFALGIVTAPMLVASGSVTAAGLQDELRAQFERFVAAQNAHDADGVSASLTDAPDFLWITPRGETLWGRDRAMERFRAAYRGTWQLEPDMAQFRAKALGGDAAQLVVPVVLTAGPPGQPARPVRLLVNQTLVRTASGWLIASILPIPAAA